MIKFRSQKTFNEFVIILIIPKKVWFLPKLQQIKEIKNILGLDDPYDLSIIIVNYNTADFIVDCLNSIAPQQGVNFEVIIVDNDSEDKSPDIVINDFPWVNLVPNETNVGFAKANNQALKICRGRFVYYLNPDTKVRSGAFRNIVSFMDSHPEVGLAGTRIVNPDGSLQSSVECRYPGQRHAKRELEGLKGYSSHSTCKYYAGLLADSNLKNCVTLF